MRVATGNDVDLPLTVRSQDLIVAPDALPVLVITDDDGAVVAHGAVTLVSVGVYKAKLTARATPTVLHATWTYTVSSYAMQTVYDVFVDGGYIFEIADLRKQEGVSDTTRYTYQDLEQARDEVTSFINDFCQVAFVPTYHRQVIDGYNRSHVYLNRTPTRSIISVKVNDVAVSTTDWSVSEIGTVRGPTPWTSSRTVGQGVVISYLYGYPQAPADMRRAAIKLAANWLLVNEGSIPDRARMMTTQWATFQLSTANEDYPTGIPEVDATLRRHRLDIPSFA